MELTKYRRQLNYLVVSIIYLIAFQKFPIFRLGGVFKLYEFIGLFILVLHACNINLHIKKRDLPVLIFFVYSPIIGLCNFFLNSDLINKFLIKYPQVSDNLKFTPLVFPFFILIFMLFHYSIYIGIKNNKYLEIKFQNVIRVFLLVNTLIAVYSLFAFFISDIILYLPSNIQDFRSYSFRSKGFSQEPSFYVVIQSWVVYFLLFKRDIFNKRFQLLLIIINLISLLFSFSSMLIAFFLSIVVYFLFLHKKIHVKVGFFVSILVLSLFGYIIISYFGMLDYVEYALLGKIENYIHSSSHTLDSGSFRNYTTRIGVEIFKDFPILGCGVGNSHYFMHIYEYKMGIKTFGERLHIGSFPQNLYSNIAAEQGLIGLISLAFIIWNYFRKLFKYRLINEWNDIFIVGGISNLIMFNSVGPTYSLFLWLFLLIGYNLNAKINVK